MLTKEIGDRCQLVGDDLLVTNLKYLKRAIEEKQQQKSLINRFWEVLEVPVGTFSYNSHRKRPGGS